MKTFNSELYGNLAITGVINFHPRKPTESKPFDSYISDDKLYIYTNDWYEVVDNPDVHAGSAIVSEVDHEKKEITYETVDHHTLGMADGPPLQLEDILSIQYSHPTTETNPLAMVDGHPADEGAFVRAIKTKVDTYMRKIAKEIIPESISISKIIQDDHKYYLNDGQGFAGEMNLAELQTWYFIEHPHAEYRVFEDLVEKMESGKVAHIGNGATIQKNKQFIELPPIPKENGQNANVKCLHPNKYVNSAGGQKFMVCPDCLLDMGDVND